MPVSIRKSLAVVLFALCALVGVLAFTGASALAAAPEAPEIFRAESITTATAALHGILNPKQAGEPGSYSFRYQVSASECEREFEAGRYTYESPGGGAAEGKQGEAVAATMTELSPGTTYTFCLVASNGSGQETSSSPETFTTPSAAARVSEQRVLAVGSSEVTVAARIAPDGLPTSYRVEYGRTAAYGSSTPEVSAGAGGGGGTPVRVRLSGLEPGVEYHFRFVASNELGKGEGEDASFTTGSSLGESTSVLPDSRMYELVSSATENQTIESLAGGDHGVFMPSEDEASEQSFRAANDGDSLVYAANPTLTGGSGAFGGGGASNELIATRGATGWSSSDISPPGTDADAQFVFFSNDLSVGFLFADNGASIVASPSSPGCREEIYARSSDGGLHALIAQPGRGDTCGTPVGVDASANGAHLLFGDEAALTAGAEEGAAGDATDLNGGENLYDSVDGRLYQVNVLPDGRPEQQPRAWLGGPPPGAYTSANYSNAVSADGSRIFWTGVAQQALYLRENDTQPQSPLGVGNECTVSSDACTVQVDAGEARCVAEGKCGSGGGRFWTATGDDSKVFFTDEKRLTIDSTAAAGEPDLYEYEVNGETGKPGTLRDLTVDKEGAHADVQGVIGAGEDGSYIYFAADGILTQAPNVEGKEPIAGEANLYVSHGGVTTFIASLSRSDSQGLVWNESASNLSYAPGNRTAEVTPSGKGMVFESQNSVTGYDNRTPEGNLQPEVFVYDALNGRTDCASCNPSGAAPTQSSFGSLSLPVPGNGGQRMEEYMQRWIADDGNRVFFESFQPLVPQDTNGRLDVYEWERNGAGSCATAPASGSERGCVYLLSGGQSVDNSYFADADAEGNNVFFTSRGKLTPEAGDENVAMYDARVDGGFPVLKTACAGTGCQGVPPASPIFATPSSVTFNGVGNFEPAPAKVATKRKKQPVKCKRRSVAKHGKCVKKKVGKLEKSGRRSANERKR